MHVLLMPDKFKGSLTAAEAADAMARGLHQAQPTWTVHRCPVADGGEGTADVLTRATAGTWRNVPAHDPLGRPISATYGVSGDGRTAFIELAEASGLHRLTPHERNPLQTTTFGTGELLHDALRSGIRDVLLCIGGSATNDAGLGMAAALGYRLLDDADQALPPVGASLGRVVRIDDSNVAPALRDTRLRVACDVTNQLFGSNGAACVYAPQKGADPAAVQALDAGAHHLADVVKRQFGRDEADQPGSGAAGGAGYGARVFLNADLQPGFALVADALNVAALMQNADVVLTGEGKLDAQTLSGKVVRGVVEAAGKKPVVAFCGRLDLLPEQVKTLGLRDAVAITPVEMPFHFARQHAGALLQAAVAQYFKYL